MEIVCTFVSADEWVGQKNGYRTVFIKLNAAKKAFTIFSKNRQVLRTIDLTLLCSEEGLGSVNITLSNNKKDRMLMLRIPKEYDLVG